MGKIIYRSEKVNTAGEVSGREHEANRTEADIGKFKNSDIDWELTNQNYDFKITNGWVDAVKEKCSELGCTVKKDSVLVIDHLITASPEWMAEQTEETKMQFFADAKDWIVKEFCGGDESLLLNCRVHKDEPSNWHLCAATIPIVKNQQRSEEELSQMKRKPRQKEYSLSAKAIMGGRGDYSRRQQSIEDEIGKKYGLEAREVREQGQAKKHLTVQQAKLQSVQKEVAAMEEKQNVGKKKYNKLVQQYNGLVKEYNEAAASFKELKQDILDLQQTKEELEKTPGLQERIAEAKLLSEAKKLENKVKSLDKICLGVNQYGEKYSLGEFITAAKNHSKNMAEYVDKMQKVFSNLQNIPINDLFDYVQNKGRYAEYGRDGKDDRIQ
jgi:hypothetical protein